MTEPVAPMVHVWKAVPSIAEAEQCTTCHRIVERYTTLKVGSSWLCKTCFNIAYPPKLPNVDRIRETNPPPDPGELYIAEQERRMKKQIAMAAAIEANRFDRHAKFVPINCDAYGDTVVD